MAGDSEIGRKFKNLFCEVGLRAWIAAVFIGYENSANFISNSFSGSFPSGPVGEGPARQLKETHCKGCPSFAKKHQHRAKKKYFV